MSTRPPIAVAMILACLACCQAPSPHPPSPHPPSPHPPPVESWGSVVEALAEGRTEARVRLRDAAVPGTWGVGALAGLRGELTLADGVPWTTRVESGQPVTREGQPGDEAATMLFVSRVTRWRRIPVRRDVPAAELDGFLTAEIAAAGLPADAALAFRVEGPLRGLEAHVIDGECPIRAGHLGREVTRPPFRFSRPEARGVLVGIYSTSGGGRTAHHGSRAHVHVLLAGRPALTGHVESVGLGAGAVLSLPLE